MWKKQTNKQKTQELNLQYSWTIAHIYEQQPSNFYLDKKHSHIKNSGNFRCPWVIDSH